MHVNTKPILLATTLFLATGLAGLAQPQPAVASGQEAKTFEKKITVTAKLEYLLSLPADYGKSRKSWPLVLFLHGSGESGSDLNKVKVHGPPKLVDANGPFPFILVSPQSPGRGWNPEVLDALLDSVIKKYRVDKDRVYLTGLSMGGYVPGRWRRRIRESLPPWRPSAAAAIRRMQANWPGFPSGSFTARGIPPVPPRRSEEMVEALQAAGGNPKFTLYPEAGHDSWTATYDNPEFYTWLLAQKRTRR